ncbi:SHOCT domain-containing protein [Salipiger mucosus]|uniref:SHOCT domain-containing protein n=1 Tax=Salipiger mucosus DSM 16094 TaxID=1123237 RepID=S9R0G7_9RHOB|nr:SHOCT domain-containing protein [Salipiger mucosus]EPX85433.1 hypothetical protein Salmuc_02814 [Salipiger mucosus DSM 16094]
MTRLTSQGDALVADIAARHGLSTGAVETLLFAVAQGGGRQAQFNHPELGGMGQWSAGGMTMVGDMFNNALKAKVDAVCAEISNALGAGGVFAAPATQTQSESQGQGTGGMTSLFVPGSGTAPWPAELGSPSSSGAQNDMRYAVFPATRRLAIAVGDRVEVYDTGDHMISGVSQQQSGDRTLTFTSQHGLVRLSDLDRVDTQPAGPDPAQPAEAEPRSPAEPQAPAEPQRPATPRAPAEPQTPAEPQAPATPQAAEVPAAPAGLPSQDSADEILGLLEKLAALRDKGILSDAEFEAKKTDLLSRL